MFNRVTMMDIRHNGRNVLDAFTLFETDEDGYDLKGWHLPVQAVANRAELFGLASDETSLEFLGRSRLEPQVEGEITAEVHPLYAAHLDQEAAAMKAGAQRVAQASGRTLMSLDDAVTEELAGQLDSARGTSLQKLGVGSVRVRMAGASRAASVAMEASDEVVQQILEVCGRSQDILSAWKMDTVLQTCPQIQVLTDQKYEGVL